jgi:hypothetical protein
LHNNPPIRRGCGEAQGVFVQVERSSR